MKEILLANGLAVLLYFLVLNCIAFILMGIDKRKAKRGAWRISERTLFLSAILGGSLGGIAGMQVFRHKTKHPRFKYGFPTILALQLVLFAWIFLKA